MHYGSYLTFLTLNVLLKVLPLFIYITVLQFNSFKQMEEVAMGF